MWEAGFDKHIEAQTPAGNLHSYKDPIRGTKELVFDGPRLMVIVDSLNDASKSALLERMKRLGIPTEQQLIQFMRDDFQQFIIKAKRTYHKVLVVQMCNDELYKDLTDTHHWVAKDRRDACRGMEGVCVLDEWAWRAHSDIWPGVTRLNKE